MRPLMRSLYQYQTPGARGSALLDLRPGTHLRVHLDADSWVCLVPMHQEMLSSAAGRPEELVDLTSCFQLRRWNLVC